MFRIQFSIESILTLILICQSNLIWALVELYLQQKSQIKYCYIPILFQTSK